MRLSHGIWSTSICLAVAAALGAAASCSLGEAKVPECDAQAAPGSPNACQQTAACDDGTGYPLATYGCCADFAAETYARCSGVTLPDPGCVDAVCPSLDAGAPPSGCPTADPNDGCCSDTITDFRLCIRGELGPGTGGQGGTATGGQGGTATGGQGGTATGGSGGQGGQGGAATGGSGGQGGS